MKAKTLTTDWGGYPVKVIFLPPAQSNANILPIIEYFMRLLDEA